MRWLNCALLCCLAIVLTGCGSKPTSDTGSTGKGPEAKKDLTNKEKLVGVWVVTKAPSPGEGTCEFTQDGKLIMIAKDKGKEMRMEGTYTVEGDKIMMTTEMFGEKSTDIMIIKKLTDTELVGENEKTKDELNRSARPT
jgi:uncharacterized protein (TIGR03066 family)